MDLVGAVAVPRGTRRRTAMEEQRVYRGVNLGGWLVLERWMSPSMFADSTAEDEVSLNQRLDQAELLDRYRRHRDRFVGAADIAYLAGLGLDLVRLPVPHWIFGDTGDAPGCVEHVDRAMEWGERYGVAVLLDLHTVPDSQNGFDAGLQGVCRWHRQPAKVDFALGVLEQLARRYGRNPALWGVEVVNEPVSAQRWDLVNLPTRYPPADPGYAEGSQPVPTSFLKEYYRAAHDRVRAHVPSTVRIVCHDGFRAAEWGSFFSDGGFDNVVVDTHQYLTMHTLAAGEDSLEGYLACLRDEFGTEVRDLATRQPVMVGEWSLGTGSQAVTRLHPDQKQAFHRALYEASEEAWSPAVAWTYWSYKLPVSDPAKDAWDLTRAIRRGYLPAHFRRTAARPS